MVIGITGGVGCGKSTVMKLLEEIYQAKRIVADDMGHAAMEKGTPVYDRICRQFGGEILQEDGQIDRKKLADVIYQSEEKRTELNAIVHPYILAQIRELLEQWREEPLVCLETALMFETGCDTLCDQVWAVTADREIRIERLMSTRGYSRKKAESIMKTQLSDEEWIALCDVCIENNKNIEKLRRRLQELLGTE